MLGRRRQSTVGDGRPRSAPFSFQGFMVFHPMNPAWGLSYDVGKSALFLTTPYQQPSWFNLRDLPLDTWVQLQEAGGRPAPVEVRVEMTGVYGRWIG